MMKLCSAYPCGGPPRSKKIQCTCQAVYPCVPTRLGGHGLLHAENNLAARTDAHVK
jgi:hypothetical protein